MRGKKSANELSSSKFHFDLRKQTQCTHSIMENRDIEARDREVLEVADLAVDLAFPARSSSTHFTHRRRFQYVSTLSQPCFKFPSDDSCGSLGGCAFTVSSRMLQSCLLK